MGFFRRLFAFLEEGPHHASSKGKPSRSLVKAAVALNKMGRKPSSNSFRGEKVASNSLVTTRCQAAACESSSKSISHHSATAAAQDESQLCVLNDAIDFEPEKQLAISIQRCRVPSTMSPRSSIESISPVKVHEAVYAKSSNKESFPAHRSISSLEPFPLLGAGSRRTVKSKQKVSGLSDLYQSQASPPIEPPITKLERRRVRQVSVSHVSTFSSSSLGKLCGLDENVFVRFPSFEQAGVKQLDELLEHESRFAKYLEEDEDGDEWGIQCGGIDEAAVSSKRHPNIVDYEKYIDDSVIQQIYEDIPEAENADFKTATKSARNLRFGNYTTGKYVKIKSEQDDGASKPRKPGKWIAGLLRKAVSLFFPKTA
ncbi:hypothetical protein JMJ77_0015253 [Colletotrichum scovillei]|uniref:Uncharacterized protein n=1 Tax=Colletotrichum scovillei TaxID=1209932 RepID=A0A9P7UAA7_9PEZI|nr:hypothetical protein JMJ77_0015253 [Colletotrichum scovillei]KAG7056908.1 hypothetical protein JMJ78_0000698 [Colletotrichum scovillei]KAG7066803.1 hypothetical protein JMJ76_0000654 [Colletotrichum scovillei]